MQLPRSPELRANAQSLRKEMTPQERKLWFQFLRRLNVCVNRQKVIGYYIADFYCHSAQTVIELDGSQHFEDAGEAYDRQRDAYLRELGLMVLRNSNRDMAENFRGVCLDILKNLSMRAGYEVRVVK